MLLVVALLCMMLCVVCCCLSLVVGCSLFDVRCVLPVACSVLVVVV